MFTNFCICISDDLYSRIAMPTEQTPARIRIRCSIFKGLLSSALLKSKGNKIEHVVISTLNVFKMYASQLNIAIKSMISTVSYNARDLFCKLRCRSYEENVFNNKLFDN